MLRFLSNKGLCTGFRIWYSVSVRVMYQGVKELSDKVDQKIKNGGN